MEANEFRQLLQETEGRLREYIDGRVHKSEQALRDYIREYIDERLEKTEQRLREYVYDAETRIVRAFGAYQQAPAVRFRKIEADVSNVNTSTTEQMDAFNAKLLELETRIVALERPAPPAA
jgi:hypothetical protein